MLLSTIVVGPLGVNCYILGCETSKQAIVVDPGEDAATILDAVTTGGYQVALVMNTHGHFDHIGANKALKEATHAPLYIHEADSVMLGRVAATAAMYGCKSENSPAADHYLEDGETITIGSITIKVLQTPGHTRGGCCFYLADAHMVITGDTLFADSVGRTDLPGGSQPQLIASIHDKLFPLADDTVVYPGHGPRTTIGHERRHNPYVN